MLLRMSTDMDEMRTQNLRIHSPHISSNCPLWEDELWRKPWWQKTTVSSRGPHTAGTWLGDSHTLWVEGTNILLLVRDQPNSWFHGRDIFREIGLLPWKTSISMKFCDVSWILTLLLSFMKVFRVLLTAFVRILLFAMFHTSALSSWHVFTVLLTCIQSWVLT